MVPVENHRVPRSQPATSGGSNNCCPMLTSGVSTLPAEKPVQPVSFIERTTYSAGQEYRVKYTPGSMNHADSSSACTTGRMFDPFCKYLVTSWLVSNESAGTVSLTKKAYSFPTTRLAVSGCIASALIKSMPSCMRAVAVDRKAEGLGRRLMIDGVVDETIGVAAVRRASDDPEIPAGEHARRRI